MRSQRFSEILKRVLDGRSSDRTLFCLIFGMAFLAVCARIVWVSRFGLVLENEGVIYVRLAENLRDGAGWVGVYGDDPHTLMSPFFSLMIFLTLPFTPTGEMAGRTVSLILGSALLLPMWIITRSIAGNVAGLLAVALCAFHGVTLGFSTAVYVEGPYIFFLFGASALVCMAVLRESTLYSLLAGLAYGAAYLLRPEAIAYALLGAAILLLPGAGRLLVMKRFFRAAALILSFIVVIAPYVDWLSSESGYFRLEGKSALNVHATERMSAGMDFEEATRGLSYSGEAAGSYVLDEVGLIPQPKSSSLFQSLKNVMMDPLSRAIDIFRKWSGEPGNLLLGVFGLLGLLSSLFRSSNIRLSLMFASMTGGYILILLSVGHSDWYRYVYPITFFAIVYAAIGVAQVLAILREFVNLRLTSENLQIKVVACIGIAIIGMLLVPSWGARYGPVFSESHSSWAHALRDTGEVIKERYGAGLEIMTMSTIVPHYARGTLRYLPWVEANNEQLALAYVSMVDPDLLVLRSAEEDTNPYLRKWIEEGLAHDCASELDRFPEQATTEIVVIKWSCSDGLVNDATSQIEMSTND